MVPLGRLTKDSILEDKIFEESIFDQEDPIYQARLMLSLEDRAEELGVKTKFTKLLNAYKKAQKEMARKSTRDMSLVESWTNFDGPYDRMQCRSWIAAEDGICLYNPNTGQTDIMACYHPILPVERLKNLETGEEQIKLAYKRRGVWDEIIVPKTMVTSATKIVALSGRGIAVTSENAKYLVRYLADVENSNEDAIDHNNGDSVFCSCALHRIRHISCQIQSKTGKQRTHGRRKFNQKCLHGKRNALIPGSCLILSVIHYICQNNGHAAKLQPGTELI